MASSQVEEEAKLQLFLQWLQVNGVELRGCKIKYCDLTKGFGVFSLDHVPDGVLLVVPLDLAITPIRVLQDPLFGPECRAMFEEGEVDDRFLIMLYLLVERLRKNSSWKPYFDMLPTSFGNSLWFSEVQLEDLKGTTLYQATKFQKKNLQLLYEEKVKKLASKLLTLDGDTEREVSYEDFLWANSIFWTRALNIPMPRSYIFPDISKEQGSAASISSSNSRAGASTHVYSNTPFDGEDGKKQDAGDLSNSCQEETVWVEGLVPGIDFCNHDLKAAATWEIDGTGSTSGVPNSMYLLSAGVDTFSSEKEISISYGNKGNEELLYLYGFVMKDNPDDYLMVHYPVEALENIPCSLSKAQLLEAQKAELRCLLPKSLLHRGFFPPETAQAETNKCEGNDVCNFSWSGQRKMPSYCNKLVFPEEFLSALRTIAMKEDELCQVTALLEELVASDGERQPSGAEVRAAIWEACGDSGALQLLVDLLNMKLTNLEEGTGTEESDTELLEKGLSTESPEDYKSSGTDGRADSPSRNRWCSIIYRQGQKQLARLFLKEAEHALQLALSEGN